MNDAFLPALRKTSHELSEALRELDTKLTAVYTGTTDPALRETLEALMIIERKTCRFFGNIRELLTREYFTEQELFVAQFFFRNYSIISENSRASKSVLRYVLGDVSWFAQHSIRILEVLKTLYAELLTLQVECRDSYRRLMGQELDAAFDFSTGGAVFRPDRAMSVETALGILSLGENATREDIKSAFRRLAKSLHPDLNPGASKEDFIDLETAYRTLLSGVHAEG